MLLNFTSSGNLNGFGPLGEPQLEILLAGQKVSSFVYASSGKRFGINIKVSNFSFAAEIVLSQHLSVKESSDILDCSEQCVRQLLRSGEISGERISSRWIIASESVQGYRCRREDANLGVPDHGRRSFSKPDLKALSFFSGCMGLDLGLEEEGINVLLACEIDSAARKTIETNRPDMALIGDIRDYSAIEIREKAGF